MKRWRWDSLRYTSLGCSFLLLLGIPLANYFAGWNFIQGWYQSIGIGDLWIVSPLEGLESLLVTRSPYGPLVIGMLLPVLIAAIMGRVFCSWVCPISFLSESCDRLLKLLRIRKQRDLITLPRKALWLCLGGELLMTLILGAPLFVFLSPPGLVGRELMTLVFFRTLHLEALIIISVIALHLISRRFFCRYLCPLGGLLAAIGSHRQLLLHNRDEHCTSCGHCDKKCPLALQPSQGEGASIHCWNCGSCIDSCPHQQLRFIKKPSSLRQ